MRLSQKDKIHKQNKKLIKLQNFRTSLVKKKETKALLNTELCSPKKCKCLVIICIILDSQYLKAARENIFYKIKHLRDIKKND